MVYFVNVFIDVWGVILPAAWFIVATWESRLVAPYQIESCRLEWIDWRLFLYYLQSNENCLVKRLSCRQCQRLFIFVLGKTCLHSRSLFLQQPPGFLTILHQAELFCTRKGTLEINVLHNSQIHSNRPYFVDCYNLDGWRIIEFEWECRIYEQIHHFIGGIQ